jgi:drug/metabolite transporter (DMT)-like permease
VRRAGLTGDATRFSREWIFAFALLAGVALVLLGAGQRLAGAVAAALCATAVLARWRATRREGRSFFGREKQSG